jgi:hypothetical protein
MVEIRTIEPAGFIRTAASRARRTGPRQFTSIEFRRVRSNSSALLARAGSPAKTTSP